MEGPSVSPNRKEGHMELPQKRERYQNGSLTIEKRKTGSARAIGTETGIVEENKAWFEVT